MNTNTTDESTSIDTDELQADVHDWLLHYQREDETLGETLDRVFEAFVPHVSRLPDQVDPEQIEREKFVVTRGPDPDGVWGSRVYRDPWSLSSALPDVDETMEDPDDRAVDAEEWIQAAANSLEGTQGHLEDAELSADDAQIEELVSRTHGQIEQLERTLRQLAVVAEVDDGE